MEVNTKLIKLESKIERVSSDLTIKFSKEIQLAFYRDVHKIF